MEGRFVLIIQSLKELMIQLQEGIWEMLIVVIIAIIVLHMEDLTGEVDQYPEVEVEVEVEVDLLVIEEEVAVEV